MIKKTSFLLLLIFTLSSCGFRTPIHDARNIYHQLDEKSKGMTPPEYYGQAKPAGFSPEASSDSESPSFASKATESDSRDGHEKKSQYIIIGTLAGLALVAGIVIPVVLLKN